MRARAAVASLQFFHSHAVMSSGKCGADALPWEAPPLIPEVVARSVLALTLAGCAVAPRDALWPTPANTEPRSADDAQIVLQPVCVGARSWSAGALGETVLYRAHRVGTRIAVGYFVYWSEERPWGENAVSYTLLPALATDAVYSHFLYLFPGIKDALYGPGDIEGAEVVYEQRADGSLKVVAGRADDGNHAPVLLSPSELVDAKGRVVLLTDVWSHQLGAHGAAGYAAHSGSTLKCYEKSALRPLTEVVARAFRLGNERQPLRGRPAWVEPGLPELAPAEQVAAAAPRRAPH